MSDSFAVRSICFGLIVLSVLAVPTAYADGGANESIQDAKPIEYVVTADRIETPKDETASSISVIDSDEISERQSTDVSQALRDVPGVNVVQSGSPGGNTSIFLRGANAEHTLVLIDGVEVNDPISTAGAFNFSDLTLDNVDRIEVLRGPQSTLYGSNAIGGVINIITKKGEGAPIGTASFEGGSYNTFIEKIGVSGGTSLINYSLAASNQNSGGFSSADSTFGNSERDGFRNTGFSGRVGITPDKETEISLTTRTAHSNSDIDNGGGAGQDDPNRTFINEEYFTRAQVTSAFANGTIKPTAGISYYANTYKDRNDPDSASADSLRSSFHGERIKLDVQNEWDAAPWLTAVAGAETQQEIGDSYYSSVSSFGPFDSRFPESSQRNNGYFAELQGKFSDVFFPVVGARLDNYTGFNPQVTYRVAPTLLFRETGTKVFSTVGTAFKAPSLYERFSEFGDLNLSPEKSIGTDAGVEQKLFSDRVTAGVTYFHNHFKDLISFDPNSFVYENIARARSEGIETFVEVEPLDRLTVRGTYTLTDTEDLNTHEQLLRRPKHTADASVRYAYSDRGSVRFDLLYVGKREDDDFSGGAVVPVTLGGYPVANVSTSYTIYDGIDLFARVDNLFNHTYEEVYGYGASRTAAFAGVKFTL